MTMFLAEALPRAGRTYSLKVLRLPPTILLSLAIIAIVIGWSLAPQSFTVLISVET